MTFLHLFTYNLFNNLQSNRCSNMAGSSKDELLNCADLDGRPSSITESAEDECNTMVSQEDKENGFGSEFGKNVLFWFFRCCL